MTELRKFENDVDEWDELNLINLAERHFKEKESQPSSERRQSDGRQSSEKTGNFKRPTHNNNSSNKKRNIKCYFCNKPGHYANECRKKMRDQKREQWNREKS